MKTKKISALVLAVAMLIGCLFCVPASADYKKENNYDLMYPELKALQGSGENYPTIIFPGINHSPYYLADEKGNPMTDSKGAELKSTLLLLNQDSLVWNIIKTVPNLLLSLAFQRDLGLTGKISALIADLMKYMGCNEDGTTTYNLKTKTFNTPVSEFSEEDKHFFYTMLPVEPISELCGEENLFLYTFALFGDPMESAAGIDAYIDMVLEKTGAEKVNIATVSLGGTMLTAYLDSGKNLSKINKVVNIVSLLDGSDIMADFIARRWNDSDEFVHGEYFPLILSGTSNDEGLGHLINILIRIMPKKLFNAIITAAYTSLRSTIMLNNPEFWAMLPAADYKDIADAYITNSALRAKTDRFYTAKLNMKKNLQELSDKGTKIYNICGSGLTYTDGDYGFFGVVESSARANSDGIIPIQSTSLGATAVKKGAWFDRAYLDSHDAKYISPDKSVDTSTCLFKDRTWVFCGQHHEVGRNDVVLRLAALILTGAVDNVDSTPLYPRFNGARNSRPLVRTEGYIDIATEAMDSSSSLSNEQRAALKPAYDKALALINDTHCDVDKTGKVQQQLIDALASVGVIDAPKREFKVSQIPFISTVDKILFKILGGNGFIGY